MSLHNKAGRLAVLLVRFGTSPAVRGKDPKAVLTDLKAGYLRRAKEEHPDLVPPAQRKAAEEQFVKLRADFEEATRLVEDGWASVPVSSHQAAQGASAFGAARPGRSTAAAGDYQRAAYRPRPEFGQQVRLPQKKEEFDTLTRIKGLTLVCGGVFAFLCLLTEILVMSKGRASGWKKPDDWSLLQVRRFNHDWEIEVDNKRRAEQAKAQREKSGMMTDEEAATSAGVKRVKEKKVRDMDNFYVKRGISNTKKKSFPRGMEPQGPVVVGTAETAAPQEDQGSALASRHHPGIAGGHPNEAPRAAPKPGGTATIKAHRAESSARAESSPPSCDLQPAS